MNKKTGPIKKAVTISKFHGVYNIADIGIYTLYTTYTYIRDVMALSVNGGTESLEKFFNTSYFKLFQFSIEFIHSIEFIQIDGLAVNI